jgi:hypothetical protein
MKVIHQIGKGNWEKTIDHFSYAFLGLKLKRLLINAL